MRYREGFENEIASKHGVYDGMLSATAVFGLLIGVGFVIAGWRGRQYWLVIWGGGLALASLAYLFHGWFV